MHLEGVWYIMESECLFLIVCCCLGLVRSQSIPFEQPSSCERDPLPGQYFDISSLSCQPCGPNQQPRADQLGCECVHNARLLSDHGGPDIECQICPSNTVATSDGYDCVACDATAPYDSATKACTPCNPPTIVVDREQNGRIQNVRCLSCVSGTRLRNSRCLPCSPLLDESVECQCDRTKDGSCFISSPEQLIVALIPQHQVLYPDLELDPNFTSFPFTQSFQASEALCRLYSNLTACQTLANLCVLLHYTKNHFTDSLQDACSTYTDLKKQRVLDGSVDPSLPDWPKTMPWLYYENRDILTSTDIKTSFSFKNKAEQPASLSLIAAVYSFNGSFLGLQDASDLLQLCDDRMLVVSSAYEVGTEYSNECDLHLMSALSQPTLFYDLYLKDGDRLFPIPVLNENYRSEGTYVNTMSDTQEWQLTRRFFLIDSISGVEASGEPPRVVRIADVILLDVKLRSDGDGHIYPPLLRIHYKEVQQSELTDTSTLSVSFSVSYSMDTESFETGVRVAIGLMSGLAFLYTILLIHGWRRRNGTETLDLSTVTTFFFMLCGTLASSYFWILFSSGAYWLLFFKGQQKVSILLPTSSQERIFVGLIISFGVLKILHMLHIVWRQVNVDIFFIDWEKPRGNTTRPSASTAIPTDTDAEHGAAETCQWRPGGDQFPVSIWRTYFIANEWNELQTMRKINSIFQILVVLFFLQVVGFSDVCRRNPHTFYSLSRDEYPAPSSRILRFSMAVTIYVIVAIIQWIFFVFIYERFIEDKIRQFVDVCSMANISVFIIEHNVFGYYIHGRSVHGRADTDMLDMNLQLKREEEDLCGKRGLLPESDQQTFELALTLRLRQQYDRLMLPVREQLAHRTDHDRRAQHPPTGASQHFNTRTLQAYFIMNRFLSAFLDHALRDFDYMVRDKILLERLMGMEFNDPIEKALFYNDEGHSFDNVVFYGNEWNLTLFDLAIFTLIDLMATDFVLAAFITYIVSQLLVLVRDSLGRRNLVTKTMVDRRFLI